MLWVILAVVGIVLLGGGAFYGLQEYRSNKPARQWVPVPLRSDLPMAEQKALVENIDAGLREDEMLRKIVTDMGLTEKFGVADEEAAMKELDRRLFVEVGSVKTAEGMVPSMNVGARGIRSETGLLGEISVGVMKEVWKIIGNRSRDGKAD